MIFSDLSYGDVFYIDGAAYQCYRIHGRIVDCLYLDADMQHVPSANDSSGLGLKTTMFSDLRFNQYNATPEQCAQYLRELQAQAPRKETNLHIVRKPYSARR